jgi:hypothetical protein
MIVKTFFIFATKSIVGYSVPSFKPRMDADEKQLRTLHNCSTNVHRTRPIGRRLGDRHFSLLALSSCLLQHVQMLCIHSTKGCASSAPPSRTSMHFAGKHSQPRHVNCDDGVWAATVRGRTACLAPCNGCQTVVNPLRWYFHAIITL